MAGDWIKVEVATPDKPEVVRMADILGIDQDSVTGKLVRLWGWADTNSVDGNALTVTKAFLDRYTNCPGFAAALQEVHWLEAGEGVLSFPNFNRHNGSTAKSRASTNRRVAKLRACNENVTLAPLQKPLPEKRREEKSIEEDALSCSRPENWQGRQSAPTAKFAERPSLAEVQMHAGRIGLAPWKAEDWFNEMEGCGWLDYNSRPVANWQSVLNRVRTKWEADGRPTSPPAAKGAVKAAQTHGGPPLKEVEAYAREKDPVTGAAYAFRWWTAWNGRQWKSKDGRSIDWKVKLSADLAGRGVR